MVARPNFQRTKLIQLDISTDSIKPVSNGSLHKIYRLMQMVGKVRAFGFAQIVLSEGLSEMSKKTICTAANFFLVRSPSLSPTSLSPWFSTHNVHLSKAERTGLGKAVMQQCVRTPEIREALHLASSDLDGRLDAWLQGKLSQQVADRLEIGLTKYLTRMCTRATPFGLLATVSLGHWAEQCNPVLGAWENSQRMVRLDWSVLEAIAEHLDNLPTVRPHLILRPNSSLFRWGNSFRYLQRFDQPDHTTAFELQAVDASPHLDWAVEQAATGAPLLALAENLATHLGAQATEAKKFLDLLVDNQVLHSSLHPPLTSPDPLGHILKSLSPEAATAPHGEALRKIQGGLAMVERGCTGDLEAGVATIRRGLNDLAIDFQGMNVVQIDLHRPSPDLAFGPRVRQALEDGVGLLRRLSPTPTGGPLDRFRTRFQERYGERWVPLLEVLDEESGIGFDANPPWGSPMLRGMPMPPVPSELPIRTAREQYLKSRIQNQKAFAIWELDSRDLEALTNPEPLPLPATFTALACLAAPSTNDLDRGNFSFWLERYSGGNGGRWLGRFASGNHRIETLLRAYLNSTEADTDDLIFAEVTHLGEPRMGNVLARPVLRDFEIPYLANSGVPNERTILPSDLKVTVRDGRIILASERLGREVVPRLASAHNQKRGPAVYRFLAHLQEQDGPSGGWTWGSLLGQPFLPRVVAGHHVLSKARWRLERWEWEQALAEASGDKQAGIQALRARRGLPRLIVLSDADHALLVDLDEPLSVNALFQLLSRREVATLTECFPEPGEAVGCSPNGSCMMELVVPFKAAVPHRHPRPADLPGAKPRQVRSFGPGSEWLSLKLYGGPAALEGILLGLSPWLHRTKADGLWRKWFFVRYWDPEPHLRLRFKGDPNRLMTELLPQINEELRTAIASQLVWKVQVDTYFPEIERYGGIEGMSLAEDLFWHDSEDILESLLENSDGMPRWQHALGAVDCLWKSLHFDLDARLTLSTACRNALRKEFQGSADIYAWIRNQYRTERKAIEGAVLTPSPIFMRSQEVIEAIYTAEKIKRMGQSKEKLASSYAHMRLNRLFVNEHRMQEWVLMEHLVKIYTSLRYVFIPQSE
jgi:thiopeptide-type bacteriocin biosynthesis protein